MNAPLSKSSLAALAIAAPTARAAVAPASRSAEPVVLPGPARKRSRGASAPAPASAPASTSGPAPGTTLSLLPPGLLAEPDAASTADAAQLALLQALGEPAWLVDGLSLRVTAVNREALLWFKAAEDDFVNRPAETALSTLEDLTYWSDVQSGHCGALVSGLTLSDGAGQTRHVVRRITPLAGVRGQPAAHFLVRLHDQTEAHVEAQARDARIAELQATLESTGDGILVTDLSGRIRAFNQRFAQIWKLPQDMLAQRDDQVVFAWAHEQVVEPAGLSVRVNAIQCDVWLRSHERLHLADGTVLEMISTPQLHRGQPSGRVWTFRDETALVAANRRIEALVTTDSLTGLINRRQLNETLREAMHQARAQPSGALALLVLDLDRFRQLNDSLGQGIGDRVLRETAERMKASLRQGDLVARLGSDTFAVLVHGAEKRGAEAAAHRMLQAMSQTMMLDDQPFTVTCSIGVALFPADGQDSETLLCSAETAMRDAKLGGRACFRFHQPEHNSDLRSRIRMDQAMRQALVRGDFKLHYQPQIDMQTGRVCGAEALLRWEDPALGAVSPADFIPMAEETGFIIPLGDWVLDEAVAQAARWREAGMEVPVAVNVSALQFQQAGFIARVAEVLQAHQLPGRLLELELTESMLVGDADEALARLAQLSAMGARLAIDDFGTGYSSLAYLKRYAIDRLKIDRGFVSGVDGHASDRTIVRAIVQMGKALNLQVIAEGVETPAQREFLASCGCDSWQGWLFAKALSANEFAAKVATAGRC